MYEINLVLRAGYSLKLSHVEDDQYHFMIFCGKEIVAGQLLKNKKNPYLTANIMEIVAEADRIIRLFERFEQDK